MFPDTSQGTMPVARYVFFESEGFEDAVRNAMSMGVDSDTIVAITNVIAGTCCGIPEAIWDGAETYFYDEQRGITDAFHDFVI